MIESNNISAAIQNLAISENIDLILMCAHGYTGETTRPYGNVTRNIIDHGTTAILIIQDVPPILKSDQLLLRLQLKNPENDKNARR